jgi:hypothetical protein
MESIEVRSMTESKSLEVLDLSYKKNLMAFELKGGIKGV